MEVFSKFWAVILGFVLIFLVPYYLTDVRKAMLHDIRLISQTDSFLDSIRYKGYLEKEALNNFMKNLTDRNRLRKMTLTHRRRAIRPVYENGDIVRTEEFFIETSFDKIKEALSLDGRYRFFIGDEVGIVIEEGEGGFSFSDRQAIIMGGMIENELTEG